jgi:hypothetical protein
MPALDARIRALETATAAADECTCPGRPRYVVTGWRGEPNTGPAICDTCGGKLLTLHLSYAAQDSTSGLWAVGPGGPAGLTEAQLAALPALKRYVGGISPDDWDAQP